jgi:hypothetical protein
MPKQTIRLPTSVGLFFRASTTKATAEAVRDKKARAAKVGKLWHYVAFSLAVGKAWH